MTKTSEIDYLIGLYLGKLTEIESWLSKVGDELLNWTKVNPFEPTVDKRIHSIRTRMKDQVHLREKLERWSEKNKNKRLAEDNFFKEIEDLAGARILVLYRHDVAIVDHFVYRSEKWKVLKAEANYDENRKEDERLFKGDLGFRPNDRKRLLKPKSGYASVHYILVPNSGSRADHYKCELQVRTIHEEAWGEFSHEFTYPRDLVDPLASRLIKRLSGLLHQAEDIVDDIRRSPADSQLFRRVHEQLRFATKDRPPKVTFDVVHQMVAEIPFLTNSALLAAMCILTKYRGSARTFEFGRTISAEDVITLGFGTPEYWTVDEMKKLYLDAHRQWKKRGSRRKMFKFFVWRPNKKNGSVKFEVPKLFQDFGNDIEFILIWPKVYDELQKSLSNLGVNLNSGYSLSRIQFLLWRSSKPRPASLPRRSSVKTTNVFGFYSPSPDPDLLAGMLWLQDKDDKMLRALRAYADLLMAVKDEPELAVKLSGNPVQLKETLTKASRERLRELVEAKFPKRLIESIIP